MSTNSPLPPSKKKPLDSYVRFSGLALQMGVIIFLFAWGGQKLDKHLQVSFPIFTLTGSLLGVAVAIYLVIRDLYRQKRS